MGLQEPVDAISLIARRLNGIGIPYMITGSVAAIFYGRSRATMDIDIIIDMEGLDPVSFSAAFAPEHFLDVEMVKDGLATNEMFNALPMRGGPKIDFIPLKPELLELTKFERRLWKDWHGTPVCVITGEDLALSKLEWARPSMSERQLGDVRAIMSFGAIEDVEYFEFWVERLDLHAIVEASKQTRYEA